MKICFIWVQKFRNFENFGCNISSSHKFHFDSEESQLISIKTNDLPLDFFGAQITDVIGIIGKNGMGKSNAVELICKILKGGKNSLQTDFLIITEENNKFICHYSFYNRKIPTANFNISIKEFEGSINPLKVVFFSNVFDERRNGFDNEIADISVNNLFRKNILLKKNDISDFEKQIKFINSKIFPLVNIEVPTKVQLTSKVWVNKFNASFEHQVYGKNYDIIKKFKRLFKMRLREIRPENKFIHLTRFGFFFEIFYKYSRNRRYEDDPYIRFQNIGEFIQNLSNLRTEEISETLLEYLRQEISNMTHQQLTLLFDENESDIENQFEKIFKQINFLQELKNNLSYIEFEYSSEGIRNRGLEYFIFDFQSKKSKNFINEFVNNFGPNSFFDINWLGISSGHKAYLNIFSSLSQELKYTRQTNLFICIDEGDLYLHPMWQIEFFDKLLNVLPTIFSGKIQLVLTSHSPFLLSDLPKQNITILDKSFVNSSQDGIDLKTNTFGGNLYDLYSEPFFLENKRTSDFAYKKIKKLIELVESKNLSIYDKADALKLSNIIGDDIIKFKIQKLLTND
ncbi:MAG: ATP-binding protein [Flavobacterium piscis]|nr:ATP-binding protein [Flavobacterium piscis]